MDDDPYLMTLADVILGLEPSENGPTPIHIPHLPDLQTIVREWKHLRTATAVKCHACGKPVYIQDVDDDEYYFCNWLCVQKGMITDITDAST
jgi:hypothetical protein